MTSKYHRSAAVGGNGRRRTRIAIAVSTALALGLTMAFGPGASGPGQTASAAPAKKDPVVNRTDIREVSPNKQFSTKDLKVTKSRSRLSANAAPGTPPVGTTRTLLALDDFNGALYRKDYTLQAVGEHIEVWVANDTSFPAGDCRLQVPNSTTVTQAQAQELANQFDSNIYPKESQAFSVPPGRDGSGNTVSGVDPTGDPGKIMTLVDNVKDDNFYEGVNVAPTYIAGFFSSQFNELLDRNIMTIDAYDWAHRTGANPPDGTTTDLCTSRPARPRLYEGTFAHEYQHLLEYYQDPAEFNWVNEGLSDFAQTLVGYVDASKTVFEKGADSHIYCYQGFGTVQTAYNPNPRPCGGPANSLTLWGDQGSGSEILADYGEAYSMMLFLYDRYGVGFMSSLHRDGSAQGLVGLQQTLDGYADSVDAYKVLHDFQVSTLVDKYVDSRRGQVRGISKSRVTTKSLNSTVNLGNPAAYASPGASANGADYVGLRAGSGLYLNGRDLKSIKFSGAKTLAPDPLRWTSVTNAPGHGSDAALWSGNESNLDASAVTQVTVPADAPSLTFDELHHAEATYDYAYVVISADGGKTYTPLANANTVKGPYGPAFNGTSADWATQTFDLSAYAGKQVLLGFRYVSDGGVNEGGFWVDNVRVGSTLISDGSSTAGFSSFSQARPAEVAAWNVRLVGVDSNRHRVQVKTLKKRNWSLSKARLAQFRKYPRVVAIVSYDEPTEQLQTPALYTLTVNGVTQPGGGQSSNAVKVKADRF